MASSLSKNFFKSGGVICGAVILSVVFSTPLAYAISASDPAAWRDRKIIPAQTHSDEAPWVMAYYVGYHRALLSPRDIDYSLMTHLAVGAVGVKADGSLDRSFGLPGGTENGAGVAFARDARKRAEKAGVKTLLWVGGPGEEEDWYAAASEAKRKTLVKNLLALMDELGYHGLDINWEPIRPKDKDRLLALVRDLRTAREHILISVPVNWVVYTHAATEQTAWYAELARYADRLFIMSYSMAGPWSGWTLWHSGALAGESSAAPSSVRSSVAAYLNAGVPRKKLGIGIGLYGVCWPYPATLPGENLQGKNIGRLTSLPLRTLEAQYLYASGAKRRFDDRAGVPYLSFKSTTEAERCGFISYENKQSVEAKAAYMKKEKLGGVMVWNMGTGYMPDASAKKRFPLLKAITEEIAR